MVCPETYRQLVAWFDRLYLVNAGWRGQADIASDPRSLVRRVNTSAGMEGADQRTCFSAHVRKPPFVGLKDNPVSASKQLGHKKSSFTSATYAHCLTACGTRASSATSSSRATGTCSMATRCQPAGETSRNSQPSKRPK
jgi:hypothetical protein